MLYTTAGDGTLVTENILGLNGGIIGSKRFSDPYGTPEEEYANRYYFYHYDIRGSVTNIVGDDGNLVKGYEYDEYGNTTDGGEESFINEVTFTGSVRDLGSGLQYMNARYYDPATGRFVSQDTYTGTPYAPWTQHLYSYCGNNPVNMVDPTGHMPIKPIAVCDGGTTSNPIMPGIVYHDTMDQAAMHWGIEYKPQSKDVEYGAMIYSMELDGAIKYFTMDTYKGEEYNVVAGFFAGYYQGLFITVTSKVNLEGFVHTHPKVRQEGNHNDYFSYMDMVISNVPGISELYLVPYGTCDLRGGVIKMHDQTTWVHEGEELYSYDMLRRKYRENSPIEALLIDRVSEFMNFYDRIFNTEPWSINQK